MEIKLQPGRYVVAVSGGVDSVALLDMLAQDTALELIVAHFDHGIRHDSAADATFVKTLAQHYGLPFVQARGELGPHASESAARQARYDFLRQVKASNQARAIVTAHHQDDVLETAILNILRGTGRRGLSSLRSTNEIQRPLLSIPKKELQAYAVQRKLSWREDSTNRDERYTRNYIRHRLLVKFDADARQQLLMIIAKAQRINDELDTLLNEYLMKYDTGEGLDRQWFCSLPHDASREVIAAWLRRHGVTDFDRLTIERLTVQAKVRAPGKQLDVLHGALLLVGRERLALVAASR